MKKSILKVSLVLVCLMVVFTACSNDGSNQTSQEVSVETNPYIAHNETSFDATSIVFAEVVNKYVGMDYRRLEKSAQPDSQLDGENLYRITISDTISIEITSLSSDDHVTSYTVMLLDSDAGRDDWNMFHNYMEYGIEAVVQPHTRAKDIMEKIGMEPDKDQQTISQESTYQEDGVTYFLGQYDAETQTIRCGFKIG